MTITINGTTGIAGVDGSASVPAFQGNDPDTGIFYPTANEVAAAAGGSAVWNASSTFGFKNRIINGGMVIDQRNAGASVTATSPGYTLDRWAQIAGAGSVTVQRTSSVVPVGFSNAYGITVASVNTRNAADYSFLYQNIEGFNVADLDLGLSTAATVTVSFWVRSSIAGLYSGVLASGDNNRSYGFTYTINAVNTWEQKSVTIVGDTSGGRTAYPVDNTSGLRLKLDLGSGSNYQVAAGSWQAATNRVGVAGTVSWAQTAGATFYITGVQLERGSTATSFDFRDYGRELIMCQRYYIQITGNASNPAIGTGTQVTTTQVYAVVPLPVSMRSSSPTITGGVAVTDTFSYNTGVTTTGGVVVSNGLTFSGTMSAVGAQGRPIVLVLNGGSAYLGIATEL